jgi:hypothetical protein
VPDGTPHAKKANPLKSWWENRGSRFAFQQDSNMGVVRGVFKRIDAMDYRRYVVVEISTNNYISLNIDHIISVEEY